MTQKSNRFERFWKELKRRKVIHVITVYAAVAFVILQLVDMVAQPLHFPEWTQGFIIVLLCIGFIIAILLSWVYDITPKGVKKTKSISAAKHIDQVTSPTSSGWKIATYASGVIIIGLVAFNFVSRRSLNTDISKIEKTIAVLPFRNDSRDTSNTYFINGLMEEILTNLQKIGAFSRVLSRNSVEQYRNNTTKSTTEIAKELGVNYIVEGSGQKYGNSYRLRVQLIAGKNERHLWADSYEKEIKETKDIYSTQNEVAQSIASALKTAIAPEEKQLIEKTPTTSLTAYDFYQRGQEYARTYFADYSNKQALKKAEELYKQSLKYDSTFAKAYVGLSRVYGWKHYFESYLSKDFLDSVLILANKALSFDNHLPDAYVSRGIYYSENGLGEKAIEEYKKALKYNSNDFMAYDNLADLSFSWGRDFVAGIDNMHKAAARNKGPDLPDYLRILGGYYLDAGFIDKAKYYYQNAFALDRDSTKYLNQLALIEYNLMNFIGAFKMGKQANSNDTSKLINRWLLTCLPLSYNEEVLKQYKKWIEYSNKTGYGLIGDYYRIAIAFWRMGNHKEANYYFDRDIKYLEGSFKLGRSWVGWGGSNYSLAAIYAFLGDKVKAYKYLEGLDNLGPQPWSWVVFIKNDPCFESIRGEERLQKIVQNMETKYQAEHERVRKWLEEQGML
jgi:TolB-like protein